MRSAITQQKQPPKQVVDLLQDTAFNDPLWLEIKEGLDAAIHGKMKVWKPRVLKSK